MRRLRSRASNKPATRRIGSINLRAYPRAPGPEVPSQVMTNQLFAPTLNARTDSRRRFGRGISMDVIENALRSAYRGSMRNITDILRETVETDPHLGSILNKRFGAVASLPYELQPASGPGVNREKAMFFAEVARQQIANMKSFRKNLGQLAWALFDGRACLELQWVELGPGVGPTDQAFGPTSMAVQEMDWIHPRRLSFGPEREIRIQPENVEVGGTFSSAGLDVRALPDKFIWWLPQLFAEYPEREGLGIRCMYWSFFKRFAARERMILSELYGKPWRIVTVDEESSAGSDELNAADQIVDALGSSYTARMPRGTKLDVVSPGRNAGQVHGEIIKESDQQNSKLVLGQTGTTDGVPAGLNSSQANVMQDEQLGVLIHDAGEISEIVETFLTDRIIAVNFGESQVDHAPVFRLRADLPADRVAELDRLKGALDSGLAVSRSEAYEISGFSIPDSDAVVVRMDQPPVPPNAPVAPAPRPVIVYPPGETPDVGEQQPAAPAAGVEEAAQGAGSPAGAASAESTVTVNEDRASRGLEPLLLPGGAPDPRGDLTVKEFNETFEAPSPTESTDATEPNVPSLGLTRDPDVLAFSISEEIAEGEMLYGEAGIHAHVVTRALEATALDGAHSHVFRLPNGEYIVTSLDGEHMHALPNVDADSTEMDGEHEHSVVLTGVGMRTGSTISAHRHILQVESTAVDGAHRHTLDVPDPENPARTVTIRSLSAGEFAAALREDALPPFVESQVGKPAKSKRKVYADLDVTLSAQLTVATETHEAEVAAWQEWVGRCGHGLELAAGQDQQSTPNGSPEDFIVKGMNELTNQTSAWATQFEEAVEGESSAVGIFTALTKASRTVSVDKFGRALERRKTQALMLGVLDSVREIAGDEDAGEETIEEVGERGEELGEVVEEQTSEQLNQLLSTIHVTLAKEDEFTKKPFAKAVAFFKNLNVLDRPSFERAQAAIKQRSFTVAGVMRDQMLRTIQADLAKSIEAGDDLRRFSKRIRPRLKDAGFLKHLGKVGPAGRQTTAMTASHIETVYRTNVLNTYNTGRFVHQSSPAVLASFPVWEIRVVLDGGTRDTHRAAHSKKLMANDPFWAAAYPPFGFNCRCRVVSRRKSALSQVVPGITIQGLPDSGFTSGRPALALG